MTNPIIEEVRAARASIAAEHGYDRTKILAWARAEQAALKMKNPNKTVVATADKVPRLLRSGRPISAVPHL
jgi:hypothetical protein